MENAGKVGTYLIEKLGALQKKHAAIGDVRGIGLMVGIEVVDGRAGHSPAPGTRHKVIEKAFALGLLTLPCGESTIRLSPPLIARESDVDKAVAILDTAFAAAG